MLREPQDKNPEAYLEGISDGLLSIHGELSKFSFLSQEVLTPDKIDEICEKLSGLQVEAGENGDKAKEIILGRLRGNFYLLNTVGVADDLKEFQKSAANAVDLLEGVLLMLDGSISKNKGEIVNRIEERRNF